jgi:hypothetical protein
MTRKRHPLLALWMLAGMSLLAPGLVSAADAGFTLPFYTFNGHILIDGAVDGRRGKFMFDTGTEFPFFLNNHYLPLAKDSRIGEGHAASGQPMVLYRQRAPIAIEIGRDVRLDAVPGLIHTDWQFLEAAYTPAFLGSIGHGFNRDYVFVIDYDAQTIAFHPYGQDAAALARVIDPARVAATLPFTPTGVDGKMPEVAIRIGDETLTAFFDTGNLGTLELTAATQARLERPGPAADQRQPLHLRRLRGPPGGQPERPQPRRTGAPRRAWAQLQHRAPRPRGAGPCVSPPVRDGVGLPGAHAHPAHPLTTAPQTDRPASGAPSPPDSTPRRARHTPSPRG